MTTSAGSGPRPPDWSREEHILAFDLYSRIPFGTIGQRNPKIVELAAILGRTPGSVSYKLANFSRLDPALRERGIAGMGHGARGEEEVWAEFAADPEALVLESQRLLAARLQRPVEDVAGIDTADLPPDGVEREALVRVRVNQSFFRRRILSAYGFRCCVTGLDIPALLNASHIVPWSEDPANRLNPRNGLCLNAFHDRAFDRHLMWIDAGGRIRFHPALLETARRAGAGAGAAGGGGGFGGGPAAGMVSAYEGAGLSLPAKFSPDPELLLRHAERARSEPADASGL